MSLEDSSELSLQISTHLLGREPIFHRPAFASSIHDFDRMMAVDYWEIGASGSIYTRTEILAHLAAHPPVDAATAGWQIFDFNCRPIGQDTYLVTYLLHQGTRHTRRATLWHHTSSGSKILYHQGTIICAAPATSASSMSES